MGLGSVGVREQRCNRISEAVLAMVLRNGWRDAEWYSAREYIYMDEEEKKKRDLEVGESCCWSGHASHAWRHPSPSRMSVYPD